MLSAERSAIEKQVLLNLVELQEKELDFYISNNASIGTMSVLLIGFAFAPELPMVIGGELEERDAAAVAALFHLSITLCVGCNLLCSVLCVFVNIHGSRLALNGPSGSLRSSVKLMSKWQGRITGSFFSGCLAFVVEFVLYSCLQRSSAMAALTALLATSFLAGLLYAVFCVAGDFSIDASDRVTSELSREARRRSPGWGGRWERERRGARPLSRARARAARVLS